MSESKVEIKEKESNNIESNRGIKNEKNMKSSNTNIKKSNTY